MDLTLVDNEGERDLELRFRTLVCKHLVRRKVVYEQVGEIVFDIGYFEEYPLLHRLFTIQRDHYNGLHNEMVTLDFMRGSLVAARTNDELTESDFVDAHVLIKDWWEKTSEHSDKFVLEGIRKAREAFISQRVAERQEEGDDIVEIVSDAKRELDTDPFSRAKEASPFSDPETYLSRTERFPTGLNFIDRALNDGGQIGDFIGFVIPSGGGKTTLGMQLCCAQVEMRKHSIIFQTEQDIEGDITQRAYVQATKIERKHWDNKKWEDVPEHARERFEEVRELWDTYFHPFSLRDTMPKSIEELFTYVEEVKKNIKKRNERMRRQADEFLVVFRNLDDAAKKQEMLGKLEKSDKILHEQVCRMLEGKPFEDEELVYVVVDWWGDIRDELMEHWAGSRSESAARRAGRTWLKQMKGQASKHDCVCIVFHQLAGEAASKSPDRVQSSHSAQEDRNFNNRMDFCFTLSVLDSNYRAKLFSDKARRFQKQQCLLQLVGELCMFKEVGDPDTSTRALTEEEDEQDYDMSEGVEEDPVSPYTDDGTTVEFD